MPTSIQSRVIEAPLDSPVTGEPVAFPSDVGSVADRIFVGDQDGTLWKVDVSNKSPDQWTMSLFWGRVPGGSDPLQTQSRMEQRAADRDPSGAVGGRPG